MGRPHACPYCKSTETVSKGVRKTKTMGARRIRRCRKCGRKFTPRYQRPVEDAPTSHPQSELDDSAAESEPEGPHVMA